MQYILIIFYTFLLSYGKENIILVSNFKIENLMNLHIFSSSESGKSHFLVVYLHVPFIKITQKRNAIKFQFGIVNLRQIKMILKTFNEHWMYRL